MAIGLTGGTAASYGRSGVHGEEDSGSLRRQFAQYHVAVIENVDFFIIKTNPDIKESAAFSPIVKQAMLVNGFYTTETGDKPILQCHNRFLNDWWRYFDGEVRAIMIALESERKRSILCAGDVVKSFYNEKTFYGIGKWVYRSMVYCFLPVNLDLRDPLKKIICHLHRVHIDEMEKNKDNATEKGLVFCCSCEKVLGQHFNDVVKCLRFAINDVDKESRPERVVFLVDQETDLDFVKIVVKQLEREAGHRDAINACRRLQEQANTLLATVDADIQKVIEISTQLIDATHGCIQRLTIRHGQVQLTGTDDIKLFYDVVPIYCTCEEIASYLHEHSSVVTSLPYAAVTAGNRDNLNGMRQTLWRTVSTLSQQIETNPENGKSMVLLKALCYLLTIPYLDFDCFRLSDDTEQSREIKRIVEQVIPNTVPVIAQTFFETGVIFDVVALKKALLLNAGIITLQDSHDALLIQPCIADIAQLIHVIFGDVVVDDDTSIDAQKSQSWKSKAIMPLIEQLAGYARNLFQSPSILPEQIVLIREQLTHLFALYKPLIGEASTEQTELHHVLADIIPKSIGACQERMSQAEEQRINLTVNTKDYEVLSRDSSFNTLLQSYVDTHNDMIQQDSWAGRENLLKRCYTEIAFILEVFCIHKVFSDASLGMNIRLFDTLLDHLMYRYRFPAIVSEEGKQEMVVDIRVEGEPRFLEAGIKFLIHLFELVGEKEALYQPLFDLVFSFWGRFVSYFVDTVDAEDFALIRYVATIAKPLLARPDNLLRMFEFCRLVPRIPVVVAIDLMAEATAPGMQVLESKRLKRDVLLSLLRVFVGSIGPAKIYELSALKRVNEILRELDTAISGDAFPQGKKDKKNEELKRVMGGLKRTFDRLEVDKIVGEPEVAGSKKGRKKGKKK